MGPSEERLSRDPARAALGALADRRTSTVFLVGPPGSGKSFVFNRLESELGARQRADPAPVFLRPTNGTRDVALGRLLVPAETTQQALSAPANGAAEPRLLAIDDIDLLDASSMSLLAQSLDRGRFRLVATVRSREAPAVFRTLRAVGRSAIVHVEPWHDEELDRFVAESLGDRMHPLTVRRLLDFTGGNALCLTELVELGSYDGHLRRDHDVWTWHGDLFVPPLTEARVSGELERVGEECRAVLTTAALVGQVPLEVLEVLHGIAAVEAPTPPACCTWRRRKATCRPGPGASCRAGCSPSWPDDATSPAGRGAPRGAAEPGLPTQRLELPAAHLAVDCSVAVPPGLAVGAAQEALRRHEPALAEEVLSQSPPSAATTNEPRARVRTGGPGPVDPAELWGPPLRRPWSPGRGRSRRRGGRRSRSWLADAARPAHGGARGRRRLDGCRFGRSSRSTCWRWWGRAGCSGATCARPALWRRAARPRPVRGLVLRLPAGCAARGRAGCSPRRHPRRRFLAESATCEPDRGSRALLPFTLSHLGLARAMRGRPTRSGARPLSRRGRGLARSTTWTRWPGPRSSCSPACGTARSRRPPRWPTAASRRSGPGRAPGPAPAARIRPSASLARRVAEMADAPTSTCPARTPRTPRPQPARRRAAHRVAEEYDRRGLRWLAAETGSSALAVALGHPTRRFPWAVESRRLVDRLHARGR